MSGVRCDMTSPCRLELGDRPAKRRDHALTLLHPRTAIAVFLLLLALIGPASAQDRPVLFFAASSLQTALNSIAADWRKETGKAVAFSYAASSALARQIENGAPADLFASADLEWMDWAQARNLIRKETRRTLLGNTLVLIAPKGAAVDLKIGPGFPLAGAIGGSRLATGSIQSVPAGIYARAALTSLGVWEQVAPRIAGTENVRAALTLVARGEAAFGIVYQTDASVEPKVQVVGAFPAATHPPILYPFAATASSLNPDAMRFLDHLSSSTAVARFAAEGFSIQK